MIWIEGDESVEDSEKYDPFSEEHLEHLIRHENGDKIMKAPVYSTKNCPNCTALKEVLKKEVIEDEFYKVLSQMGHLDVEKVKSIIARRLEDG